MSDINLGAIGDPSLDLAWRLHAVKLAVQKNLAGRARLREVVAYWEDDVEFCTVVSQSEPGLRHTVTYRVDSGSVQCDCTAAQHGSPCAHAGAVLLLCRGLAPEDAIAQE